MESTIKKYKYGLSISKDNLNETQLDILRLSVKPKCIDGYGPKPKPIILYKETQGRIIVPYYFGTEFLKDFPNITYTVQYDESEKINLTFNGTMRNEQNIVIEEVLDHFKTEHRCLLNLRCGFGKSIITLKLITLLKKKTLIIVHKEFLMSQWAGYIKQFIPDAKVGFIRQNTFEPDCDIVIGMLQSLCMRTYPKITDIALTIIDEAHNICATVFSTVLFKYSSLYMIGLSATPERKSDGLGCILEWTFGKFITVLADSSQKVNVDIIETGINIVEKKLRFSGNINIQDAINQLVNNDNRNKQIIASILKNIKRNILIVTDRVAHVKHLHKLLNDISIQSSIFIGGMKQEERNTATETNNILIATFQMVKEGFDLPRLDVLIFATPKKDIIQVVGRITRKIHNDPPLIIDIFDKTSVFERWGYERFRYYKTKGYGFKKSVKNLEPIIEIPMNYSDVFE
jgi:superfamily II DNA or RNA helicase